MTDHKPETRMPNNWLTEKARSTDQREQRYAAWLLSRQLDDTEDRRRLFMRRYTKPEAPRL